jgi:DNA modification methylase
LQWAGKRAPQPIPPPSPRLVETRAPRPPGEGDPGAWSNLLFHGDNLSALSRLLADGRAGQVKLIYIDPPFASGADYARRVRLRGARGGRAFDAGGYALGGQTQYSDAWADDDYLQFMYARLFPLRDLLSEDGSLWLHCDYRRAHHLRLLLDEVFGPDNYLNTIAWRSQVARGAKVNAFYFPYSTHYLEVYARNRACPTTWNPVRKRTVLTETQAARAFMRDARGFFRTSDPGTYSFERLKALHAEGRLYAPRGGEVIVDQEARRVYASLGGNIGVKYYLQPQGKGRHAVERAVDNLWDDIPGLGTTPGEDLGYPTQKTEALLQRVVAVSTNPGDLVLDCFAGSGTALAVAQRMGRRWIGCDANRGAIQTAVRRLGQTGAPPFAVYRLGDDAETAGPQPQARVTVARDDGRLAVRIDDFASPAIAERLARHADAAFKIADWRSMVDSVAIDPDYDGQVLRAALVDAPMKKHALVAGVYTLEAPPGQATVAVRITDIMGGEAWHVCHA